MSQPTTKPSARPGKVGASSNSSAGAPTDETFRRIDGEHGTDLTEAFDHLPQEAIDEEEPRLSPEAVELHAKDLAKQLAARRRDLDLRETRLHRQLMLLDQERQAARLSLAEQEQEIDARLIALAKREKEVADQMRRGAAAEAALRQEYICVRENLDAQKRITARDLDLLNREQERLRSQSASLDFADRKLQEERAAFQQEVDTTRQALHRERKQLEQNTQSVLAAIKEKQVALAASAEKLAKERRELSQADRSALEADRTAMKRAEAEYLRLSSECEKELRGIAQRRTAHDEDCRNERRRLLLERESMQVELSRERAELSRRQTSLEDAQAALQKAQAELLNQQRSILEERLAVEQVMQSLGRHPAPQSAATIQTARQKLAEHYRWMKESLQTQKSELLDIAKQLDGRERAITEDRDALQDWAEAQQSELDTQLIQLEAQRQQIQRREAELSERELRWAAQKKGLEGRLAIAQARAA